MGRYRSEAIDDGVVAYLNICHRMASVLIQILPYTDEMVFDGYNDDFRFVVTTIEEYYTTYGHLKGNVFHKDRFFAFETRLLWPIIITALHCRDPSIRRRASSLLIKYDCQEGPWSSFNAVPFVELVITMEENGIDYPQSASDIPAANHVSLLAGKVYTMFTVCGMWDEPADPFLNIDGPAQTLGVGWSIRQAGEQEYQVRAFKAGGASLCPNRRAKFDFTEYTPEGAQGAREVFSCTLQLSTICKCI